MRDALLLMARCSQAAGNDMIRILKTLPEEKLNEDVGLYFKSIVGAYRHYVGTNVYMFNGLIKTFCKPNTVLKSKIANGPQIDVKDLSFTQLAEVQQGIDELAIEIISNIEDFHSEAKLDFPTKKFPKPRYQIIMGILTHGTHHRGQIAAVLDMFGVENDFPGMLVV